LHLPLASWPLLHPLLLLLPQDLQQILALLC
jgi:hypothetical protein